MREPGRCPAAGLAVVAGSARPSGQGRRTATGRDASRASGAPQAAGAPHAVTVARGRFGASPLQAGPGGIPSRKRSGRPGADPSGWRGSSSPHLRSSCPAEGARERGGWEPPPGGAGSPAGGCRGGVGLREPLGAAPLLPLVSGRGGPAGPAPAGFLGRSRARGAGESEPVVSCHIRGDGAALAAGSGLSPSSPARLSAGAGPVLLPQPCLPFAPWAKGKRRSISRAGRLAWAKEGFWQL